MQPDPGLLAAFAVGLLAFLSPCVLPLLPGYISMLSGVAVSDLADTRPHRLIAPVLLFVAAFSSVFVVLGLAASELGRWLVDYRTSLELLGGLLVSLLGVFFVLAAYRPGLARDFHPLSGLARAGGPLAVGVAFALAWTPCIGPTLAAVLTVASVSPASGAWLLLAYSLGLALPFISAAWAFAASERLRGLLSRHFRMIGLLSGLLLVLWGLLIALGRLPALSVLVEQLFLWLGLDFAYRF